MGREHLDIRVAADQHLLARLEPHLSAVWQDLHQQICLRYGHPRSSL
jgi:hypothetical protein